MIEFKVEVLDGSNSTPLVEATHSVSYWQPSMFNFPSPAIFVDESLPYAGYLAPGDNVSLSVWEYSPGNNYVVGDNLHFANPGVYHLSYTTKRGGEGMCTFSSTDEKEAIRLPVPALEIDVKPKVCYGEDVSVRINFNIGPISNIHGNALLLRDYYRVAVEVFDPDGNLCPIGGDGWVDGDLSYAFTFTVPKKSGEYTIKTVVDLQTNLGTNVDKITSNKSVITLNPEYTLEQVPGCLDTPNGGLYLTVSNKHGGGYTYKMGADLASLGVEQAIVAGVRTPIKLDGVQGDTYGLRIVATEVPACPAEEEGVFKAYSITPFNVSALGVHALCGNEGGGVRITKNPSLEVQGMELKALVSRRDAPSPDGEHAGWMDFSTENIADFPGLSVGSYRAWVRMQRSADPKSYCVFNAGVRDVEPCPVSLTFDPSKIKGEMIGCEDVGNGTIDILAGAIGGVAPSAPYLPYGVRFELSRDGSPTQVAVVKVDGALGDVAYQFNNLGAGVYNLRVYALYRNVESFAGRPNSPVQLDGVDVNQCEIGYVPGIVVAATDQFALSTQITAPFCHGGSGEVLLTCSGGSDDWTSGNIAWTPGDPSWTEETPTVPHQRRYIGVTAGSYTVKIQRRTCLREISFDVSEPDELDIASHTVKQESACGVNDGAILVGAQGGTAAYQWAITPAHVLVAPSSYQSVGQFENLAQGGYNVWLKDANGCAPGGPFEVTVGKDAVISVKVTLLNGTCFGDEPQLKLLASGEGSYPVRSSLLHAGAAVWTGKLKKDVGTIVPFNLTPGTSYVLRAQDARGCDALVDQPNVQPIALDPLVVSIDGAVMAASSCRDDGAVQVRATGGTPAYEWAITLGASSTAPASYGSISHFTNLEAGAWRVWVKDANGCAPAAPLDITVAKDLQPEVTVNLQDANCAGEFAHVTLTALEEGRYPLQAHLKQAGVDVWSGELDRDVALPVPWDLAQGLTYDVEVKDARGCDASLPLASVTPAVKPVLTITMLTAHDDELCPGAPGVPTGSVSATVTGDTEPFVYKLYRDGALLKEGATEADGKISVTELTRGEYRLEASKDGCEALPPTPSSVIVGGKLPVRVVGTIVQRPSQGASNGELRAQAMYEHDESAPITPTFSIDPSLSITVTPVGAGGASFTNVPEGKYTITAIVDACPFEAAELDVEEILDLSVVANTQQPKCAITTALVELAVSGGVEPYSITWTYSDGTPVPSVNLADEGRRLFGLAESALKVTVHDAAVPPSEVSKDITIVPFVPSAVTVAPRLVCAGDDGQVQVTLTSSGSVNEADLVCALRDVDPTLTFDAAHQALFTGLAAGTYALEVRDAEGCNTLGDAVSVVVESYFTERKYAALAADCPPDAIEGTTTSSYSFDFQPVEDVNVEYALENAVGTLGDWYKHRPQDGAWEPTFEGTADGTYTLHVRDEGGAKCTLKKPGLVIRSLAPYGLTFETSHTGGCGAAFYYTNIKAKGSALSGSSYFWTLPDGSEASGETEYPLPTFGTYTVQVREATCKSPIVSVELKKSEALSLALLSKSYFVDGGLLKANVRLAISGGVPFDNAGKLYYKYYVVENGNTDPFDPLQLTRKIESNGSIEGLEQGKTKIIVADQQSCYASQVLIPGSFSLPVELKDPELYHPSCIGQANGSIVVQLEEGTDRDDMVFILEQKEAEWRYVMTNGDGAFHHLKAGTYRVRVKDKVGQVAIREGIQLKDPEPVTFVFTHDGTKPTCPGATYTAVKCGITGGTAPYLSAVWEYDDRRAVAQFEGANVRLERAKAGSYRLTVTDAQGCEHIGEYTYPGIEPYRLVLDKTAALCAAYEEGSLTIESVAGGIPNAPLTLTWLSEPRGGRPSFRRGDQVQIGKAYSLPAGRLQMEAVQGSCIDTLSVDIETVNPPLQLKFEDEVSTICYNARIDSIRLSGDGTPLDPEVYGVLWDVTHGVGTGEIVQLGMLPLPRDSGAVQYYRSDRNIIAPTWLRAKVRNPNGCLDTVGKLVVTHPSMHFAFDKASSRSSVLGADEQGRPFIGVLAGIPTELAFVHSPGVTNVSYTFSPSEMFLPGEQPSHHMFTMPYGVAQNPDYEAYLTEIARGKRSYVYLEIEALLTNEITGCSEKLGLLARSVNDLSVPNVFTPNGDGRNDRWLRQGDPTYENIFTRLVDLLPNIEVEVYTRSGVQVWQAKGQKVAEGWDGRSSADGAQMPIGTYYYVMRFNVPNAGKAWKPISGSVTIVR